MADPDRWSESEEEDWYGPDLQAYRSKPSQISGPSRFPGSYNATNADKRSDEDEELDADEDSGAKKKSNEDEESNADNESNAEDQSNAADEVDADDELFEDEEAAAGDETAADGDVSMGDETFLASLPPIPPPRDDLQPGTDDPFAVLSSPVASGASSPAAPRARSPAAPREAEEAAPKADSPQIDPDLQPDTGDASDVPSSPVAPKGSSHAAPKGGSPSAPEQDKAAAKNSASPQIDPELLGLDLDDSGDAATYQVILSQVAEDKRVSAARAARRKAASPAKAAEDSTPRPTGGPVIRLPGRQVATKDPITLGGQVGGKFPRAQVAGKSPRAQVGSKTPTGGPDGTQKNPPVWLVMSKKGKGRALGENTTGDSAPPAGRVRVLPYGEWETVCPRIEHFMVAW